MSLGLATTGAGADLGAAAGDTLELVDAISPMLGCTGDGMFVSVSWVRIGDKRIGGGGGTTIAWGGAKPAVAELRGWWEQPPFCWRQHFPHAP